MQLNLEILGIVDLLVTFGGQYFAAQWDSRDACLGSLGQKADLQ